MPTSFPPPPADAAKVLVIGWDAADWKVIRPLIAAGKMPHLEAFLKRGIHGNLASLDPMFSPMLWTSIATGKRPYDHGILGFTEPDPGTGKVRPVSSHSRRVKAIWNMLSQEGYRSHVIGWWPSHPVEPINGVMVSNHYQQAGKDAGNWPLPEGTVHPERLNEALAELRVHPSEFSAEELKPFLPTIGEMLQDPKLTQRANVVAKLLAHVVSVHAAATAVMQLEPWDFMGVYFDAIDHFGHSFMRFHPPRQEGVGEEEFRHLSGLVEACYRYHDLLLGTLLKFAGPEANVLLISDHGFHPDHLRPKTIPAEPAGPAFEHRPFGVFAAAGPAVAEGGILHGATLLDIAPTVLSFFGLPVGQDMAGRVLYEIFRKKPVPRVIPSWEERPGADGRLGPEKTLDPAAAAEALRRLADLGYIDPDAAEQTPEALAKCQRELDYNLARSLLDGGRVTEAIAILERLWLDHPVEFRFAQYLAAACHQVRRIRDLRRVVETFIALRAQSKREAQHVLEALRGKKIRHTPATRQPLRLLRQMAAESSLDDAYLLGLVQFAEGQHEAAAQNLYSPGSEQSREPRQHQQISAVYLAMKRPREAVKAAHRALELDPESTPAWLNLANAYLELKEWEPALDAALKAIELLYQQPRAHKLLGDALCGLGDYSGAVDAYRLSLSQAPFQVGLRQKLIDVLEKELERKDEAAGERGALQFLQGAPHSDKLHEDKGDPADGSLRVPDPATMDFPYSAAQFLARETQKDGSGPDGQEPALIVSGLPRSGTSLLMQLLAAAEIPILTDEKRSADTDNPQGYYEYEPVKRLAQDRSWLSKARGQALKIVAPLLRYLPVNYPCRVIFMVRDLEEVLASQAKMLERAGKANEAPGSSLKAHLQEEVQSVLKQLDARENVDLLLMEYPEIIARPRDAAEMIAQFLDRTDLPLDAMAATVRPDLYRQRN